MHYSRPAWNCMLDFLGGPIALQCLATFGTIRSFHHIKEELAHADTPGNGGPLVIRCLWHWWLIQAGSKWWSKVAMNTALISILIVVEGAVGIVEIVEIVVVVVAVVVVVEVVVVVVAVVVVVGVHESRLGRLAQRPLSKRKQDGTVASPKWFLFPFWTQYISEYPVMSSTCSCYLAEHLA